MVMCNDPQVKFVREPATTYDAGLALNDMVFSSCPVGEAQDSCPQHSFHCGTSRACVTTDRLCDLADDCGDGSDELACSAQQYLQYSFEPDQPWTGLFTSDPEADLSWQLASAEELGAGALAPTFDHTRFDRTGHFLYLPLSARKEGEKARMYSRPLEATTLCTPRFFYHLYGAEVGALRVFGRYEDGSHVGQALFEKTGDQGNVWWAGRLEVSQASGPWELVVEGEAGAGLVGDVALDDWSLPPGCRLYTGPWHGGNATTEQPTPGTSHTPPHTTHTEQPTTPPPNNDDNGISTAVIVGIIAAVLVVIVMAIGLAYWRVKKR
jgi:hypothetical protein